MQGILTIISKINDVLSYLANIVSALIVAIMVSALTASAVTRYISGTGYDWLIELPPVLVPWLVFPLIGPLLRSGSHIQVDLLPTFLSGRQIDFLKLFVSIATLVGAVIFLLAGKEAVDLFRSLGQLMELEIDLPIWWMYLAFPVGFGMLLLFAVEQFLMALTDIMKNNEPEAQA